MFKISLLILTISIIFIINKYRFKIARLTKLIDKPDKIRKFHEIDTPLLGGVMIFVPFLLVNIYFNITLDVSGSIITILIISSLCFVIGLIDDIRGLAYKYKFIFLILIFYYFTYSNPNLQINKIYFSSFDKIYSLDSFGIHFTVLCLLLLSNAINLIDGIDGLCILVSNLVLSWLIFFFNLFDNVSIYVILISLFYIFFLNLKKNIFLGDSGSLFIGTFIGLNLILYYNLQSSIKFYQ